MRALRRKRGKDTQFNANAKRPKKAKGRFFVDDAADK